MKTSLLLALGLAAAACPARAATYRADPAYSAVRVSVRHFLFFHPAAVFEKVEGSFDYEAGKPEVWKASVTVLVASVNANKPRLERKLASPRYLDAAGHPAMTFVSTKTSVAKDGRVTMEGELTIKGATHPASFQLEVDKPIEPRLDDRMGISAHGFVDRRHWGIAGGPLTGDRVEVIVLLQGEPALP